MRTVRCLLLAALLSILPATSRAGAPIDSLVPLPPLTPRDPAAGLHLTPHALTIDPMGRPWILDRARGRILALSETDGTGSSMSVTDPQAAGSFPFSDLAASGSYLYLLDPSSPALTLVDLDGYVREWVNLAQEIEIAGRSGFSASGLLVGRSGDLWLIDLRGEVLRFDRRGRFLEAPLDGLAGGERPHRISAAALAPDDALVLLDPSRPALLVFPATGGSRPPQLLQGKVAEPASLAVDGGGDIFVLDATGRIRVIDRTGAVLYDGTPAGARKVGMGRAAITPDGILMRADPAGGTLQRWRIVRTEPQDEER
jgi:hypothetical protein